MKTLKKLCQVWYLFLKYTQISISLICFSCGKVEYITYKFNISVFQRKVNTIKNSKLKKYMLFDNDDKKDKDKEKKERKVWIVWWGADRSS